MKFVITALLTAYAMAASYTLKTGATAATMDAEIYKLTPPKQDLVALSTSTDEKATAEIKAAAKAISDDKGAYLT